MHAEVNYYQIWFLHVKEIIKASIFVINNPLSLADNMNLRLDNSLNHAQPHPIIIIADCCFLQGTTSKWKARISMHKKGWVI